MRKWDWRRLALEDEPREQRERAKARAKALARFLRAVQHADDVPPPRRRKEPRASLDPRYW